MTDTLQPKRSTDEGAAGLTLDDYQQLAMRTNGTTTERECLSNAALGICGEGGEFADTVKKILHHGHPLDDDAREHMAKELGDALWYVAQGATAIGFSLGAIARGNIDKLRKRYPDGFSAERSINRDMSESLTVDGENETGISVVAQLDVAEFRIANDYHFGQVGVTFQWSDNSQPTRLWVDMREGAMATEAGSIYALLLDDAWQRYAGTRHSKTSARLTAERNAIKRAFTQLSGSFASHMQATFPI